MKKMKKLAIVAAATVLACSAFALSACGGSTVVGGVSVPKDKIYGDEQGIEFASESEFNAKVNLNESDYTSYSNIYSVQMTYNGSEIVAYTTVRCVDETKQIAATVYSGWADEGNGEKMSYDGIATYTLFYKDAYYSWNSQSEWDTKLEKAEVKKVTKAEYDEAVSGIKVTCFYGIPVKFSELKFDSGKRAYTIDGHDGQYFKFTENFIYMIDTASSPDGNSETVSSCVGNFNKTKIDVPQYVYDDIDAFIAK